MSGTELPQCDGCRNPIDDCACRCAYCGRSAECDCAIGPDVATGG